MYTIHCTVLIKVMTRIKICTMNNRKRTPKYLLLSLMSVMTCVHHIKKATLYVKIKISPEPNFSHN